MEYTHVDNVVCIKNLSPGLEGVHQGYMGLEGRGDMGDNEPGYIGK